MHTLTDHAGNPILLPHPLPSGTTIVFGHDLFMSDGPFRLSVDTRDGTAVCNRVLLGTDITTSNLGVVAEQIARAHGLRVLRSGYKQDHYMFTLQ